ncbi:MAG: flagellar hook-basal body complex protein FliE [Lachnospirales bacterium]
MRVENSLLTINKFKENTNQTDEIVTPNGQAFSDIFDSAINLVAETSDYQKHAQQMQVEFATGATDDILAVTMAQEKALSSLNFTVQITNKIIDAYKEIMQIQL